MPVGLVAGSYYTFVYPHAPATVGSSGSVLFVDAVNVTFRGSITGLQATQHEQLSIAGDQMTFTGGRPSGEPCDSVEVGVYRFTVSGPVLRFQTVHDTCKDRQWILAGHDMKLVG